MTVNLFAGMGSHQSAHSETDIWFSPPAILEALGGWQSFDLDPCSHTDRPWPTAQTHYTQEDNGLILPWDGRIWLNPPYSIALITRFLGRLAEHDRGTALIFARTETDPFHRFVWNAASGLLFLRGRLNFHRKDGRRAEANGGAPSVLIAYGAEDCEILAAAPIDGAFVPLRLKTQLLIQALAQGTTWAQGRSTRSWPAAPARYRSVNSIGRSLIIRRREPTSIGATSCARCCNAAPMSGSTKVYGNGGLQRERAIAEEVLGPRQPHDGRSLRGYGRWMRWPRGGWLPRASRHQS